MSKYPDEAAVTVYPFSRQEEGNEILIGRVETGTYLALPADAVEILDHLAAGRTVGEARELYRRKYAEIPDMEDLLQFLAQKGFISAGPSGRGRGGPPEKPAAARPRNHFERIPQSLARRIFSTTVIKAGWIVIVLAIIASALEPGIVPGRTSLYFAKHRALYALSLFLLGYLAVFIHEMGHLVAARAVGVGSRLSISHRLWVLVAETDLTGLWSVAKRERYLPLLAGPLLDAVSAALLLLTLFAHARTWISLPGPMAPLLEALVFLYLMRLVWQCFFFVRTDFYYVIASFFNCRNLLGDTEAYLRNRLASFGWGASRDQSHIPPGEARVIRAYAPIWLVGRALSLSVLVLVTLPLAFKYVREVSLTLGAGYASDPYAFVDSIVLAGLTLVPLGAGLGLWITSLIKSWSRNHGTATRPA